MPIDYGKYTFQALVKSIRNNKKQIEEHEKKMANPSRYVSNWKSRNEHYKQGIIRYWKKEIRNLKGQIRLGRVD